jgi:hypothetical protein
MRIAPLVAVGFCFQNFTELVVPPRPTPVPSGYGTTANTVNGAAEDFVRTQWMPELRNLEARYAEKLQFRIEDSNPTTAEMEMNLLGNNLPTIEQRDFVKVSIVNDKVRLRFEELNLACDYHPAKDLVSVRSQFKTPGQIQLEHSGRDRTSRLSWNMTW